MGKVFVRIKVFEKFFNRNVKARGEPSASQIPSYNQSSSAKPLTRLNSPVLLVTKTLLAASAAPAMRMSNGPIGLPSDSSCFRIFVASQIVFYFRTALFSWRIYAYE
jgi:hypothetical protein